MEYSKRSDTSPLPFEAVRRYVAGEPIDDWILLAIEVEEGADVRTFIYSQLAAGGVLWVATCERAVVAYQWSKRGLYVGRWFVDLADDDIVIYSTVTVMGWRGRGIAPALMQWIADAELGGCARVFADCKVWNVAAIRGLEKAGFVRVFPHSFAPL